MHLDRLRYAHGRLYAVDSNQGVVQSEVPLCGVKWMMTGINPVAIGCIPSLVTIDLLTSSVDL